MRILLVHTNRERAPQPVVPLGVCLVASALEARGFEPRVIDLCFSRHPQKDLQQAFREWPPQAVGMSVRNLDNGEYLHPRSYLPDAAAIARVCREHSSGALIIGGPAVSIAPAQLLRRLAADYAVVGDGEAAMADLVERLIAGEPTAGIPGVYSSDDAEAPRMPARVRDLDSLPRADAGRWLALRRYARHGSPLPVQSKRGCSFECIYCTYRLIEGPLYRLRSPEAVAAEMEEAAARWDANRFEFADSTFNHPVEHAVAVCEAIARSGLPAELHTMGLNPASVSAELLALMKRAGFRSVVCAPESGSQRMLQAMRKGFGIDQVSRAAAAARKVGLSVLWSFMFGGPGECEDTVRETIEFMQSAFGPSDRILCTVGVRIYPGTELERIAQREGALAPGADLVEPTFYFSPRITAARVLALLDACRVRSQMLYLGALQERCVSWALRLRSALHLPGPAWGAVPLYNRLARWAGISRR